MKEFETEEVKTKGKIIVVTTLSIIGAIIILFIMCVHFIKSLTIEILNHRENYYSLNINDSNRSEIMSLLESKDTSYCESMYKMEYINSFPHSQSIVIYCKDEKDIHLREDSNSELMEYIQDNGEWGER